MPAKKKREINEEGETHCQFYPECNYKIADWQTNRRALNAHEARCRKRRRSVERTGMLNTWYWIDFSKEEEPILLCRRDDEGEHGLAYATALVSALSLRSFSLWHQENLEEGMDVKEEIIKQVETTEALIILYPGCLEACINDDDFFRWELSLAMQSTKNKTFLVFGTETTDSLFPELKKPSEPTTKFFADLKNVLTTAKVEYVSFRTNFEVVVESIILK